MRVDVMEKNEIEIDEDIIISQQNCMICEFMGGVYGVHPMFGPSYYFKGEDKNSVLWGVGFGCLTIEHLQYHSNIQWLFAVCRKISFTIPIPTDEYGKLLYSNIFNNMGHLLDAYATFLDVVEFIKWYNSNPTRTGQKLKDDES